MIPNELIEKFCNPYEKFRKILRSPFVYEGQTYATNAHIAIRVEFDSAHANYPQPHLVVDGEKVAKGLFNFFRAKPAPDLKPIPEWNRDANIAKCESCNGTGKVVDCPECDGQGEVDLETSYHDYTCECKTCHGDGVMSSNLRPSSEERQCFACYGFGIDGFKKPIVLNGIGISAAYLRLIESLPNPLIDLTGGPMDQVHFAFDGGRGIVMPMRIME